MMLTHRDRVKDPRNGLTGFVRFNVQGFVTVRWDGFDSGADSVHWESDLEQIEGKQDSVTHAPVSYKLTEEGEWVVSHDYT